MTKNTKALMAAAALTCLACAPLSASTAFSFPNLNGVQVVAGEYISPYDGSLAGQAVKIFCDDFNDSVPVPSNYNVNVTTVNAADLSATRFGTTNFNAAYPTGTTLYEEFAWLFTQMQAPGQSQLNKTAIQEAVWHMSSSTPGAVSTTSLSNTGANLTYLQWIAVAQADYRTSAAGYATPDYSKWMILTDVANATTKTVGTGNQELLAYYNTSNIFAATATPEPATLGMFGLGLAALLMIGRRRRNLAPLPIAPVPSV